MGRAPVTTATFLTLLATNGCRDISRFSTAEGESYCGQIVDSQIVRRGFLTSVKMRLTFDADHISDTPGALSTDDLLLTNAPLRPIPELSNDPLFTFTFGEGRDKNLLYAIDPTDPAKGPPITVVLSLMHTGDAEVRLLRAAPGTTDAQPLFGVFAPLRRETGQCSF